MATSNPDDGITLESPSTTKPPEGLPEVTCGSCGNGGANVFCVRCQEIMCVTCGENHVTNCGSDAVRACKDVANEYRQELGETSQKLEAQKELLHEAMREVVASEHDVWSKQLEHIESMEENMINEITARFRAEQQAIRGMMENRHAAVERRFNDKVARLERLLERAKHPMDDEESEALAREIDREMEEGEISDDDEEDLSHFHQRLQALTTEMVQNLPERVAHNVVPVIPPVKQLFKNGNPTCQKVGDLPEVVYALLYAHGQLWVLFEDRIEIFAASGKVLVQTAGQLELDDARDMCINSTGAVVVATLKAGLQELGPNGAVANTLTQAPCWSVTYGGRYLWCLKADAEDFLSIDKIPDGLFAGRQSTVEVKTEIMATGENFRLRVHDDICYISACSQHCVYVLHPDQGTAVQTLLDPYRDLPTGRQFGPILCLVDRDGVLIVADKSNDCIQTYDPSSGSWTRLSTESETTPSSPAAVAVDPDGLMYVAGLAPSALYKYHA